jgi:hypothetical protein
LDQTGALVCESTSKIGNAKEPDANKPEAANRDKSKKGVGRTPKLVMGMFATLTRRMYLDQTGALVCESNSKIDNAKDPNAGKWDKVR